MYVVRVRQFRGVRNRQQDGAKEDQIEKLGQLQYFKGKNYNCAYQ
jgi:hypothetical protein